MEDEATAKIRQQAAERRTKILQKGTNRLEKIQGLQTPPKSELENQSYDNRTQQQQTEFFTERELHHEVKKPNRKTFRAIENIAVVMKKTRKTLVLMAVVLGALYAIGIAPPDFNPFTLLLITQISIIVSTWSYFLLYPGAQQEQVERLRLEAKFKRLSGQDWKPSFLYWIPGFTVLMNSIENFRICSRGFTEPVSVFVVTFVLAKIIISASQQNHQCCAMH